MKTLCSIAVVGLVLWSNAVAWGGQTLAAPDLAVGQDLLVMCRDAIRLSDGHLGDQDFFANAY
jgi:hypothetical protein